MDELIKAVGEAQKKRGLSDRKLSQLLGIDPAHWSRIKRGLAPASGGKFLTAVTREFPELHFIVLKCMAQTEKAAVK